MKHKTNKEEVPSNFKYYDGQWMVMYKGMNIFQSKHLSRSLYIWNEFKKQDYKLNCLDEIIHDNRNNGYTEYYSNLEKVNRSKGLPRNVNPSGARYVVTRTIRGKPITFGSYKTVEEAGEAAEYYNSRGWDLDKRYQYGNCNPPRNIHISDDGKKFTLYRKYDQGKVEVVYGVYDTITRALNARDYYKSKNWFDDAQKYNKSVNHRNVSMKYITLRNGKYVLTKAIDGKMHNFGTFNNLEDAMQERELLIQYDWTFDYIDLV